MPLKGDQLSLLPAVSPYFIENPPLPGEPMTTRSGTAIVTRLEPLGKEVVIWGDYGSGVEQPHGRENATCELKIVLGGRSVYQFPIADTLLTIDPLAPNFESEELESAAQSPLRKIVLGGGSGNQAPDSDPLAPKCGDKACGWIGKKTTKRQRKNRDSWVCEQWWLYWEEPGGKKRSRYIPKAKLADVERSVYGLRQSICETLKLLGRKEDNS